jgi:hypothetical protein
MADWFEDAAAGAGLVMFIACAFVLASFGQTLIGALQG